ncbi:TrbA, partial [Pseudomonas savastanoi pv. glycinea]
DGLQAELESIGLVFARHIITPKRREASDLPVMTAVYAVQPTELTEPA